MTTIQRLSAAIAAHDAEDTEQSAITKRMIANLQHLIEGAIPWTK